MRIYFAGISGSGRNNGEEEKYWCFFRKRFPNGVWNRLYSVYRLLEYNGDDKLGQLKPQKENWDTLCKEGKHD